MRLHNSLTGRIETFGALHENEVRMYNCGPTVYKRQHIGNFRAFSMADLLRRSFEFLGYRVTQIMNITDVGHLTEDDRADAGGEDKLQREAARRALDPWEIARQEEQNFKEDLRVLRIRPAHHYPRATEHVPEMLEMIEALITSGHAYQAGNNVYFDVNSFEAYGALSGNTLSELETGASGRTEDRGDKRNPQDFALWKSDPKHIMQWDSPFGRGFPGWHIECSAMSRKYLGDTLDIHTGGPDNKFPHHECEIAQSECVTREPFVRYWVHCGRLEIEGEKMSKRAGALYTVPELVERGYTGADLRVYLLKQHYRSPLPFDFSLLDEARRIRQRIANFVEHELADRDEAPDQAEIREAIENTRADFRAALEDDLNTSSALASIHTFMNRINRASPGRADAERATALMHELDAVFDILGEEDSGGDDAEIETLVVERDAARAAKDFDRADSLRDELSRRGVELLDTPQGTRWRRR